MTPQVILRIDRILLLLVIFKLNLLRIQSKLEDGRDTVFLFVPFADDKKLDDSQYALRSVLSVFVFSAHIKVLIVKKVSEDNF